MKNIVVREKFCNFAVSMLKLLLPIAWIYSVVLFIRHKMYDWGVLKSKKFDLPVICVGNIALGGTGKTPHTEYIVSLLREKYKVAVLSRGYRRKSEGFVIANKDCSYEDVGDEPLQYCKYDGVVVAVDEKRCNGVKHLLALDEKPELVILDDAFQHRQVKAGLNIVLTDYSKLFTSDSLVPSGTLRDIKSAVKRSDIIVVTKGPSVLSPYDRRDVMDKLQPYITNNQLVCFSHIVFKDAVPFNETAEQTDIKKQKDVILFTGVANSHPLEEFLSRSFSRIVVFKFADHHAFTSEDIDRIVGHFESIIGKRKVIITTEKDAMRLKNTELLSAFDNIPLYYIPIKVRFNNDDGEKFEKKVLNYVRENITDDGVHQE